MCRPQCQCGVQRAENSSSRRTEEIGLANLLSSFKSDLNKPSLKRNIDFRKLKVHLSERKGMSLLTDGIGSCDSVTTIQLKLEEKHL